MAVKTIAGIVRQELVGPNIFFACIFVVGVVLSEVLPWVRQGLATSLGVIAAVYKTVPLGG